MSDNNLNTMIMHLLSNNGTVKVNPILRETSLLEQIDLYLAAITDRSFFTLTSLLSVSDGIVVDDRKIKLKEDWGVKLTKSSNSFIDTPSNIRTIDGSQFFITNSTIPNAVVDANLNLVGSVGNIVVSDPDLESGEYVVATDFTYSPKLKKYFVVAGGSHIVHIYNSDTSFLSSLGNGESGAADGQLNLPTSIAVGRDKIFVLCSAGTPDGSSGIGFLATYKHDLSFISNPLYCGLHGGTGRIFQGEILTPKDITIFTEGGKDRLVVLNSTDEIGVFDTDTWELKDTINIPSNYTGGTSLGLSRISVSEGILYITASNVGQIIAIDMKTKKLIGSFGEIRSESFAGAPQTLGLFNGLTGIAVYGSKIQTTETLNNRIQSFGKNLIANPLLYAQTDAIKIPQDKNLVAICMDISNDLPDDLVIVNQVDMKEYDIRTAIAKKIKHFAIKIIFRPSIFSSIKKSFDIYPIYINVEE